MANIGFIGLGIMGAPMAGHLLKGGHTVYTYTHGDTSRTLLEAGAKPCASGAEVARNADIIITMVPDTPHVEDAL
ncbi:MAG: NAD(P)-binding domain-containing protein, partial [Proteobacteria bacterium]|nr:NAD(P)-binding domain-containing protein [Pseudomonadota bacterium]